MRAIRFILTSRKHMRLWLLASGRYTEAAIAVTAEVEGKKWGKIENGGKWREKM